MENWRKVRISEDPWIGVDGNFKLLDALLVKLHDYGIYSIRDAISHDHSNAWGQGWMTMKDIYLQNKLAKEWTLYTNNIYHYELILKEEYDQLKWLRNKGTSDYMVKLGCAVKVED